MHTPSTDPRVLPPPHVWIPSTSKVYPLHFTRMTPFTSHTDTLHFTRRPPPLILIHARTPSTTLLQILAHAVEFWHYSTRYRGAIRKTLLYMRLPHVQRQSRTMPRIDTPLLKSLNFCFLVTGTASTLERRGSSFILMASRASVGFRGTWMGNLLPTKGIPPPATFSLGS